MRLRKAILIFACLGLPWFAGVRPASAESVWCPTTARWISTGDTSDKVLRNCGPPKSRENVTVPGCTDDGRCFGKIGERWVYDFGSNYLIRYLLFVGGRLTQVEVGEYGE